LLFDGDMSPETCPERGFRFACDIVRLYVRLLELPRLPQFIARQLLKSGTSIGANLEEAKAAHSRRDSAAKFSIALKEARETAYWLKLISTTGLAPVVLLASVLDDANEMVAVLTVARRKLKAPESNGNQTTQA
jgi:four helix bundle protein